MKTKKDGFEKTLRIGAPSGAKDVLYLNGFKRSRDDFCAFVDSSSTLRSRGVCVPSSLPPPSTPSASSHVRTEASHPPASRPPREVEKGLLE